MYTIKQAAARSGLNVPTVRAWERRYGVVQPARTPAGYRLYDDAAIDRLIAMRHLVERQGLRPSQAADQVRAGGAELAALIDRAAAATETTGVPHSTATRSGELVNAFVTAAGALDVAKMDRLLDEAFAAQRFEAALEDVVFPALRRVGEGWSEGSIDVAMEHAASETIRRRLVRFYELVAASSSAPQVIVGLPPGCHHENGALAFAIAARRAGVETSTSAPTSRWRAGSLPPRRLGRRWPWSGSSMDPTCQRRRRWSPPCAYPRDGWPSPLEGGAPTKSAALGRSCCPARSTTRSVPFGDCCLRADGQNGCARRADAVRSRSEARTSALGHPWACQQ